MHTLRLLLLGLVLGGLWPTSVLAVPPGAKLPPFELRLKLVEVAGQAPAQPGSASLAGQTVVLPPSEWSDSIIVGHEALAGAAKRYPNSYSKVWPLTLALSLKAAPEPTVLLAEARFPGETPEAPPQLLKARLFGPNLGLTLWRDADGQPRLATMAEYNRRNWAELATLPPTTARHPRFFPFVDRYIPGDQDLDGWLEGINGLADTGFSVIMLPPEPRARERLLATGLRRTSWAVYNPPGYAFDFEPDKTGAAAVTAWAEGLAEPWRKAGYAPEDMALYAMSDEPGWYFPSQFKALSDSPTGMARFRDYLIERGMTPELLGLADWAALQPRGRAGLDSLAARRLYYWTMRFFAWDSARHFANSTRAMEAAFYPRMPIVTNWNFFSGRFVVPGPVANNGAKEDPNAAMGGHDWFEFGRMRGGTMLWTEDWFGDERAWQWSFYASKLNSAAKRGGVVFGGYVIPRTAGSRESGLEQKVLSLIGGGGKAMKTYVYGPEYTFPGNCYSHLTGILPALARANRLVAAAEDLLWPGQRPAAEIAILMPRSSMPWDALGEALPKMIQDATNTDPNRQTVDYLAEVFSLYMALQHANLPVDFVDEDDLATPGELAKLGHKVIFATEPDLPQAGHEGLLAWLRAGGHLVTVAGFGQNDAYHEPCPVFSAGAGVSEMPRQRLLVPKAETLPVLAQVAWGEARVSAVGALSVLAPLPADVEVLARFGEAAPAVVRRRVGQGTLTHFAWFPGMSYAASSKTTADRLPVGHDAALRELITLPVRAAGVAPRVTVSQAYIETPVLISEAGMAISLLNWSGAPVNELELTLPKLPFTLKRLRSVQHGDLPIPAVDGQGRHRLRLALKAADVLCLYPE